MSLGSLRLRLLFGAAAFILIAVTIAAGGLVVLFERHVKTWIGAELNAHLDQLTAGVDGTPSGELAIVRKPADPRFEKPLSGLYWEADFEPSQTVVRSRSLWDFKIALPVQSKVDDEARFHKVAGPDGQTLFLLQRSVELPQRLGRRVARLAVGLNEAEVNAAVWRFAQALTPFLLVLAALLSVAAWVQVSIGLRPLSAMQKSIADIRSGRRARLGGGFPDEVQPLANEIDTLLDARDLQVERAKARAADLAHGLKTPIQILFGGVRRLKSKAETAIADDIETAASMMQRHVDRQLARARMAANDSGGSAQVKLVAEQVLRVVGRSTNGEKVSWSIAIPDGLSARIHPDDLAEALGNLVENAARHARSRVALTASTDAGFVTISVTDDGPGMPQEFFADALDRGSRLDTSRAGFGLGLAIAAEIAEACGGSVEFANFIDEFSARIRLRST